VAEAELEVIDERDALIAEAERRLSQLEADLEEIANTISESARVQEPDAGRELPAPGVGGTLPAPYGSTTIGSVNGPVDPARLDDLRSELNDLRARIAAIEAEAEEPSRLAEVREEVSTRVAGATREVREALYDTRWAVAVRM
jgi:hypothetical protein